MFKPLCSVPCVKALTLYKKSSFSIEAFYSVPREGFTNWIGTFKLNNIPPSEKNPNDPTQIKIKARINQHGVVGIDSAQAILEKFVEVHDEPKADTEEVDKEKENNEPVAKKDEK